MKAKTDYLAIILLGSFFLLLTYAGYLAYQSIDWDVLRRVENAPIALPTAISPTSASPAPNQ